MSKVLHIKLYGDVENVQADSASEWGIVNLKTVSAALDTMPDAEEIVVHIHSRGGDVDEGFAIHDLLRATGKKITTITEGLCASIATVIFMAGTVRKMTANSTFFIHCPWTFGVGNADQLEKTAEDVRVMEDKMLDFYVSKTGGDRQQISDYMKDETSLTPDKALELKFVTEIVDTMSAKFKKQVYAKYTTTKQIPNEMKASDIAKEILALLKGDKAQASTEGAPATVKSLDLELADGEKLHVQTEAAESAIGDTATYQGKATPDKTYELKDGRKVKTDADSKIVDITPAETTTTTAAAAPAPDAAAKDKEVSDLKAKVASLEAAQVELNKTISEQKAELEANTKAFGEIKEGIAALRAATKSGHKVEGEQTRYSRTGQMEHTDDVTSAVAAYKRRADNRRMQGGKAAMRVETEE